MSSDDEVVMEHDDVVNLLARWFVAADIMGSIHLCIEDPGRGDRAFVWVPHSKNRKGKPDCIDAISVTDADHLFRIVISQFNSFGKAYDRKQINEAILIPENVVLKDTKVHGIYQPLQSGISRRLFLTKDVNKYERERFNSQADEIDRTLNNVWDSISTAK